MFGGVIRNISQEKSKPTNDKKENDKLSTIPKITTNFN